MIKINKTNIFKYLLNPVLWRYISGPVLGIGLCIFFIILSITQGNPLFLITNIIISIIVIPWSVMQIIWGFKTTECLRKITEKSVNFKERKSHGN